VNDGPLVRVRGMAAQIWHDNSRRSRGLRAERQALALMDTSTSPRVLLDAGATESGLPSLSSWTVHARAHHQILLVDDNRPVARAPGVVPCRAALPSARCAPEASFTET